MAPPREPIITSIWKQDLGVWGRALIIWVLLFVATLFLTLQRASAQNEGPDGVSRVAVGLAIVTGVIALVGAWILELASRGASAIFLGSSSGPARPPIDISQIRGHLRHERWDEARALLQDQWSAYPGDGELLREWERLLNDGMKAPTGMVDFFEKALPDLKGEDRAYAYLRMAEVCADHLNRKPDARKWVQRLVVQHPDSPMAAQARLMLDQLPKEDPKAGV